MRVGDQSALLRALDELYPEPSGPAATLLDVQIAAYAAVDASGNSFVAYSMLFSSGLVEWVDADGDPIPAGWSLALE